MEIRFQRIFLAALCLFIFSLNSFAAEQQRKQGSDSESTDIPQVVDIERRDIIDGLLDSENFELGIQAGFISIEDFESNLWLSGHLAYHINEYFYAKVLYGSASAGETSFEKLANVPPLLTDEQRDYRYYGLNIGYNLMPGEVFITKNLAFNSLFSIELGGGSTEFSGDEQFTVNLVANYRVFLNDWITWDISMSDYIFDNSVTGVNKTTHNLNFSTGFSFYF